MLGKAGHAYTMSLENVDETKWYGLVEVCALLRAFQLVYGNNAVQFQYTYGISVYSNNFLTIDIYYGQLKTVEVEQKQAYDEVSFMSK